MNRIRSAAVALMALFTGSAIAEDVAVQAPAEEPVVSHVAGVVSEMRLTLETTPYVFYVTAYPAVSLKFAENVDACFRAYLESEGESGFDVGSFFKGLDVDNIEQITVIDGRLSATIVKGEFSPAYGELTVIASDNGELSAEDALSLHSFVAIVGSIADNWKRAAPAVEAEAAPQVVEPS